MDVSMPDTAQTRLKAKLAQGFIKRNKDQTIHAQKRAQDARMEAMKELRILTDNDLLIIGTSLYWAEGYKRLQVKNGKEVTSHIIGLTNSDPGIVSAFILFLQKIIKIPPEKIFIEMRLFEHIDPEEAVIYWMKVTRLERKQFRKPSYPISSASKGIRPKNRLPYGTVQVIVSDTKLFHRIIGLIEGLKEKLELLKK
jgi:hypothetical protein